MKKIKKYKNIYEKSLEKRGFIERFKNGTFKF